MGRADRQPGPRHGAVQLESEQSRGEDLQGGGRCTAEWQRRKATDTPSDEGRRARRSGRILVRICELVRVANGREPERQQCIQAAGREQFSIESRQKSAGRLAWQEGNRFRAPGVTLPRQGQLS